MAARWWKNFSADLGIDLGTSRIRIWSSHNQQILDEASCIAVDKNTQKIIAVGDEAAAMKGRVAAQIEIKWPVCQGDLADHTVLRAMLQVMWQKVLPQSFFLRPKVVVSTSLAMSPASRELLVEILSETGALEVITISQSLAAAIGAGVPVADASGSFIVHLGAGVMEATAISLGTVVVTQQSQWAGVVWQERLQQELQAKLKLKIGRSMAEKLLREVLDFDVNSSRSMFLTGQHVSGSPTEYQVTARDLSVVAYEMKVEVESLVKKMLASLNPQLTVDVIDKGILLTGGLAQVHGLDSVLIASLGVPVTVVDEPQLAVVKGLATTLENLDDYRASLSYYQQAQGK